MPDQTIKGNSPHATPVRFKDMGDGTYAEVCASEPLGVPTLARQLAATTTSQNTALSPNCRRISIRARFADIRFVIGTGAQTANASTSHYIAQDERLDFAVPPSAQIAVIRESSASVNGSLALTELA